MSANTIDSVIRRISECMTKNLKHYLSDMSPIVPLYELKEILETVLSILQLQNVFPELTPPIKIVADVHGQLVDLLRILKHSGWPPNSRYLFLGDYVDRGPLGVEVFLLVAALKCKFPNDVWLLRGNHESGRINARYGFKEEVQLKYGVTWVQAWKLFMLVFDYLPLAALIGQEDGNVQPIDSTLQSSLRTNKTNKNHLKKQIFAMHGGLSPDLKSFDQLRQIRRPMDIPAFGLECDLAWADPEPDQTGWAQNSRNLSFTFGEDIVRDFCRRLNVSMIVRGHQVPSECSSAAERKTHKKNKDVEKNKKIPRRGFKFFAGTRLLTLFSVPNYMGLARNEGTVLSVDRNFVCTFETLKPSKRVALTYDERRVDA